jgi:hypothetical protein
MLSQIPQQRAGNHQVFVVSRVFQGKENEKKALFTFFYSELQ